MKIKSFTRFYFTSLMTVGAIIFSATVALALPINEPFTAGAEIVGDVTAINAGDPNFGKIIPPTAGNADYVMDPATGVVTTTGTGSVGASTLRQAGTLNLTGPVGQSVLITSPGGACAGPGGPVGFNTVTFNGTTAGNIGLTGATQPIGVGGTLNVDTTALGAYTCPFTVTVDFAL